MKPISRFLRRMRDAATPAQRPLVVVFMLAEPARPPEAEAAPAKTLPHLDIELAIGVFERADMPENTRKAYTGELRRQAEWLDGRPHTDRLLEAYLDMLDDKGRAPPSAATAVAAVERAVRELALDGYEIAEPPAGPLAARRLKRFRREGAERGTGQVRALTWDEVKLMCKTAEGDHDLRGRRDAAIFGVMADGLMRVSEVSALNAEDVSFLPNGTAEALIRRSKSDQHARGDVAHIGAVAAERLRSWIEAAGIKRGPLFRSVDRWERVSERRLGPDSVRAAIKRRAREAGIPGRVSGHSLRIGTAQRLAEEGASLVEIQKEGRWKSPDMPAYYIRGQETSRGAVARLRAAEEKAKKRGKKGVAPPEPAVVKFG